MLKRILGKVAFWIAASLLALSLFVGIALLFVPDLWLLGLLLLIPIIVLEIRYNYLDKGK